MKKKTIKDQWEAQVLARILRFANVFVVTKNMRHELIQDVHMIPASPTDEALSLSHKMRARRKALMQYPFTGTLECNVAGKCMHAARS